MSRAARDRPDVLPHRVGQGVDCLLTTCCRRRGCGAWKRRRTTGKMAVRFNSVAGTCRCVSGEVQARARAPHSAGGRDQPFCLVLAAAVTQNALQRLPANARTLPLSLCAENPVRPFAHSADSRVLMCKLGSGTPPTLRYVCRFHRRILYRGLSAACHPDQDKVGRVCTKHQSIPSVHIVGHARRRAWPSYRGKALQVRTRRIHGQRLRCCRARSFINISYLGSP